MHKAKIKSFTTFLACTFRTFGKTVVQNKKDYGALRGFIFWLEFTSPPYVCLKYSPFLFVKRTNGSVPSFFSHRLLWFEFCEYYFCERFE